MRQQPIVDERPCTKLTINGKTIPIQKQNAKQTKRNDRHKDTTQTNSREPTENPKNETRPKPQTRPKNPYPDKATPKQPKRPKPEGKNPQAQQNTKPKKNNPKKTNHKTHNPKGLTQNTTKTPLTPNHLPKKD